MYLVVTIAPTRVEFLFRVLVGMGMLFQVGTLYSSVSLRIRSCNLVPSASGSEGEHLEAVKVRRKSGSACLLMNMFA